MGSEDEDVVEDDRGEERGVLDEGEDAECVGMDGEEAEGDREEGEGDREEVEGDRAGSRGEGDDLWERPEKRRKGRFVFAPSLDEALTAHADLVSVLEPKRASGRGYKKPNLDDVTHRRLAALRIFLHLFIERETAAPEKRGNWTQASWDAAHIIEESTYQAENYRQWGRAFIQDRDSLPEHDYGKGNRSLIEDEDLSTEIHLHLQSIGKYIKADDIVKFMGTPEMLERTKRTKTISIMTARS